MLELSSKSDEDSQKKAVTQNEKRKLEEAVRPDLKDTARKPCSPWLLQVAVSFSAYFLSFAITQDKSNGN